MAASSTDGVFRAVAMHAGVTDELLAKYGRLPRGQTGGADGVVDCPQVLHPPSVIVFSEIPPPVLGSSCVHPPLLGTEDDDGLTLELPEPKKTQRGRLAKYKVLLRTLMQDQRRSLDEQERLPMDAAVASQPVENALPEHALVCVPESSSSTIVCVAPAATPRFSDHCDFPCIDGFMVVPDVCQHAIVAIKQKGWSADDICEKTKNNA